MAERDSEQIHRAAHSSREQLRGALEHLPAMVMLLDSGGEPIWVNRAFRETLGWGVDELEDRPLLQRMYPDAAERNRVTDFLAAGEGEWVDLRARTRDGGALESSWSYRRLDGGRTVLLGFDRTRPPWTSEQQAFRVRHSGELFEDALDAILVADREGRYVDVNPATCRLLGYDRKELLELEIWDVLAPEERDAAREAWGEFLEQGRFEGEAKMVTSDGRRIEVEHRSVADVLPGLHVTFGREITERKEAERRLRESEARFRSVFEHAGLGIVLYHPSQGVQEPNPAFCRMVGRDRDELVDLSWEEVTHPDDIGKERSLARELLRGDRDGYELEKRYLRPDGEIVWAWLTTTLLRSPEGEPEMALAMVRDVTERLGLERDLQRYEEELHRLAGHLQSAREEEQRRIARRIHDDLGQRLASLKLGLSWLRRSLREESSDREEALQELDRLNRDVESVLEETRRLALELRPTVLDDLGLEAALEWLVDDFRRRIPELTFRLQVSLGGRRLEEGTETALFRIIQEAIINLVRHSGARRASISLESEDGGVRLWVRDDGRGFDPGAKGPESLGILSMEERARANGGLLAIRSAPGSGTTVEAWFSDPPVPEAEAALEPDGGTLDEEESPER